jgi:hypothetical protein
LNLTGVLYSSKLKEINQKNTANALKRGSNEAKSVTILADKTPFRGQILVEIPTIPTLCALGT